MADVRFCSNCGHQFRPGKCPNCDAELRADATFCAECGFGVNPTERRGGSGRRVPQNVRVVVDRRGGCASGCLIPVLLLVVLIIFVCGAAF
ncbi:MAG: zinc ribbon domain-containing protein [Chloroflexi bacterium]|nr:zinc ribbon domain-containing protein [Chloroflexota bacterium]